MASTEISLKLGWLNLDEDSEKAEQAQNDLLALFYREVASGPMTRFRRIPQSGSKQGQSYFSHALDGINVIHKLRQAGVIEMTDLEEKLLIIAFLIHDINKIPPWGGHEVKLSYVNIATRKNIEEALEELDVQRFLFDWKNYLPEIMLLMPLHQHDSAPLADLDRNTHDYTLNYYRLEELGHLMYAVDNLDLSHTLAERKFKEGFLNEVNKIAERQWQWVTHRLGENRGLLTNLIQNEVVAYLKQRYPNLIDLLYYPDGVAYLLPKREQLSWTDEDTNALARQVAAAVEARQGKAVEKFIKGAPAGIKVDIAAFEGGASFNEVLEIIYSRVSRKRYNEEWHSGYLAKLRPDLEKVLANPDVSTALASQLLSSNEPLVPLVQTVFQLGELATAYRNLLQDHLKDRLKKVRQIEPWPHIYALLNLPSEKHELYNRVDGYRRGYFIARDCPDNLETIFERMLEDVSGLSNEEEAQAHRSDGLIFRDYIANNLQITPIAGGRNFRAQLDRYIKEEHHQCSNCSTVLRAEEWMAANAPASVGVQFFSNRLVGGSSREPKRNICGVCRAQFILEKLAWPSHDDRHGGKYTSFYLQFYPYSFFTALQLDLMYSSLKNLIREDQRSFFLSPPDFFEKWSADLENQLGQRFKKLTKTTTITTNGEFEGYSTKINGVGVPEFAESVGNTPTLPLNAPGNNYGEQFIFALTHALMLADFFGCRVVLSRTPVPLLTDEYLSERELALVVDGTPRNLRWLLPTDEYSSLEIYRDKKKYELAEYERRRDYWGQAHSDNLRPDRDVFENVFKRLKVVYALAQELKPNKEGYEATLLDLATAAADDPLGVYYIADRAIEKKVKDSKGGGKGKTASGKAISPEGLAISLGKRVAPLLNEITQE